MTTDTKLKEGEENMCFELGDHSNITEKIKAMEP
jgi:hypothetical protein